MVIKFKEKEYEVKNSLNMIEAESFVRFVVEKVVNLEEETYEPFYYDIALAYAFLDYYAEVEGLNYYELYDILDEVKDCIDQILYSDSFNKNKYDYLIEIINKEIEFKKEILLKSKNSIDKLVEESIKTQIEFVKSQKKATEEALELNRKFSPEDINNFTKTVGDFTNSMKDPKFQKTFLNMLKKSNEQDKNDFIESLKKVNNANLNVLRDK